MCRVTLRTSVDTRQLLAKHGEADDDQGLAQLWSGEQLRQRDCGLVVFRILSLTDVEVFSIAFDITEERILRAVGWDCSNISTSFRMWIRHARLTVRFGWEGLIYRPQLPGRSGFVREQPTSVQPNRRLDDGRADQQLSQGKRGREQEDQSPLVWRRESQAHGLGDHDSDDDGELREHAWFAVSV